MAFTRRPKGKLRGRELESLLPVPFFLGKKYIILQGGKKDAEGKQGSIAGTQLVGEGVAGQGVYVWGQGKGQRDRSGCPASV